ncbi:hypothetical protein YPPY01_4474, partial [Yersinia pestis PY-01]
MRAIASSSG